MGGWEPLGRGLRWSVLVGVLVGMASVAVDAGAVVSGAGTGGRLSGFRPYQQKERSEGWIQSIGARLVLGAKGTGHLVHDAVVAQKLKVDRSFKGRELSLRRELFVKRNNQDLSKLVVVWGFSSLLKINPVVMFLFFPWVEFPSTLGSEEDFNGKFKERLFRRAKSAEEVIQNLQNLELQAALHHHGDSGAQEALDVAGKVLAQSNSGAMLTVIEPGLTSPEKGGALQGIPGPVIKGISRATLNLPLGIDGWGPGFMCKPFVNGALKSMAREDDMLTAKMSEIDTLNRRDLVDLAVARGLGSEVTSRKDLIRDLKDWLRDMERAKEKGLDDSRSRYALMGVNTVQYLRQGDSIRLQRQLYGSR